MNQREVVQKYGYLMSHTIYGSDAATSANYGVFFNATHPIDILRVVASWTANSTSGNIQLERLTAGETLTNGDDILATAFDTSTGANTSVVKKARDLDVTRVLPNERLALNASGTLTSLVNFSLTIYYKPVARGEYIT